MEELIALLLASFKDEDADEEEREEGEGKIDVPPPLIIPSLNFTSFRSKGRGCKLYARGLLTLKGR